MPVALGVFFAVTFSVVATIVAMMVTCAVSQQNIPSIWWAFGVIVPFSISLPVSILFARQSQRNHRLNIELLEACESLKRLSETDQMTDMLNRTAFFATAEVMHQRAPGSCLMVDVDNFKSVNDTYGHQIGDDVLRTVAEQLRGHIRSSDLCGRMGGEEFAVYLPRTGRLAALAMAERLRQAIATARIETCADVSVTTTVSIGVATTDDGSSVSDALRKADLAMYQAKQQGRNQVRMAA